MGRQGIVAVQGNRDIKEANDQDQVVSQDWPLLRVAQTDRYIRVLSKPYDFTITNDDYPKIKHGLGFIPLFFFFDGQATLATDIKPGSTGVTRAILAADEQYLYWIAPGFGGAGPDNIFIDFRYVVCPIDLTVNFEAPAVKIGTSPKGKLKKVGLRITDSLKGIDSTNLEDFIVTTEARSPAVHKIVYGLTDTSGRAEATHNLPYDPMFLAYQDAGGGRGLTLINGFAGLETSPGKIVISQASPNTPFSIVFLKDPFSLGEDIQKVNI